MIILLQSCDIDEMYLHVGRYRNRPVMSGPGLYDPTSIMNHEVLSQCQREGWVKLAFYLLAFFYYLYGSVSTSNTFKFPCGFPCELMNLLHIIVESLIQEGETDNLTVFFPRMIVSLISGA